MQLRNQEIMKRELDKQIFALHADVCKILANPKRLEILQILRNNELTVTEIVDKIGANKANISQHLAIMRIKGILCQRREGQHIYYRVANNKVIQAFDLMREVLFEQLSKHHDLVNK